MQTSTSTSLLARALTSTRLIAFYMSLFMTIFMSTLCAVMIFTGDHDRVLWVSTLTAVWGVWMQAPKLRKKKESGTTDTSSSLSVTP